MEVLAIGLVIITSESMRVSSVFETDISSPRPRARLFKNLVVLEIVIPVKPFP